MRQSFQPSKRFKIGDPVIVTSPLGIYRDKQAVVMEVIEPRGGDSVYRYRVRFTDGTAAIFFGFELELKES